MHKESKRRVMMQAEESDTLHLRATIVSLKAELAASEADNVFLQTQLAVLDKKSARLEGENARYAVAENVPQKATIGMMEARYKVSEDARAAACSTVVRLRPFAFLPNEILIHIFARAHPHDIVSILCTCKRFCSAGDLFIKGILARSLTQHQLDDALLKYFSRWGNIQDGAVDAKSYLRNAGANPNHANRFGAAEVLKYFPRWGPRWGNIPDGAVHAISHLCNAGANVNHADRFGRTPLYHAAEKGDERCVATLLKTNADVNLASDTGRTPLFMAAQEGHEKCVSMLIKANADVNLANNTGQSPLYAAA
jgi:hypothetical protein